MDGVQLRHHARVRMNASASHPRRGKQTIRAITVLVRLSNTFIRLRN